MDVHHLDAEGRAWEMGAVAPEGSLVVPCPALAASSPRGEDEPEFHATVYRDGEPWQEGCV